MTERDVCVKCGRLIVLRKVGTDAYTGRDVLRWCSTEVPYGICPVDAEGGSYHVPVTPAARLPW